MADSLPAPHHDADASGAPQSETSWTDSPARELYREKLVPSVGMWLGVGLFGLGVFLVGAPISVPVGLAIALVLTAILGLLLWGMAPVLRVTEDSLQVGRAHIEREFVGQVEAFRGDAARVAAGPAADGRAFMNFRPWVSPVARIHIVDPADPTPYWLTNTRHPEALAMALGSDPAEQSEDALAYEEPAADPEDNPGWSR